MDKEDIKKEIARVDWEIYLFEPDHSNLLEFRELINERMRLEAKLKAANNYVPVINLLTNPVAWWQ